MLMRDKKYHSTIECMTKTEVVLGFPCDQCGAKVSTTFPAKLVKWGFFNTEEVVWRYTDEWYRWVDNPLYCQACQDWDKIEKKCMTTHYATNEQFGTDSVYIDKAFYWANGGMSIGPSREYRTVQDKMQTIWEQENS
jgi:hypothetical protein